MLGWVLDTIKLTVSTGLVQARSLDYRKIRFPKLLLFIVECIQCLNTVSFKSNFVDHAKH
eukprot:6486724-Amphidinium_carterae.1